ncbi:ABC transporter substrate-binding protein [Serinibacter arcticus]|uniref:ABC transporter substrate-binding protein n=1 Tax=Serinibacter arcticus TaxID=1655435 RepID=A0A2U1ZYL2_9MICO|nr:extracellular solute-binding protein [Serinibacter arcticus]PWD52013.1 ABC transporter substrate-binding protein [Serinibacter arcticus]
MRKSVATVAVALAATLGLAACGSGDDDGVELTWYINPDAGGQALIAQQCTEEAAGAYTIATALLPRDADSQREQLARRLAANDTSIDLMSLDPPYIPELARAGFLAPVPDELAATAQEQAVQGALETATWEDELVTVPFWSNTQLLWYRTSVAEAAGLDMSQPVTWDQLIDVAREQDVDLAVQGIRAESLTVWLNSLVVSAGGEVISGEATSAADVDVTLDSEAGAEAARILSTIGQEGLGGPGLPTADENANLASFQGDAGSFMVNWPFVWPALNDAVAGGSLDQAVLDDLGWAMYPAMIEGEGARPPVGGINLGVSAFSGHVEESYDAIACITDPAKQAAYFVSDGNPPSATSSYDDPAVQEEFPMAPLIRDSLEAGAPRPLTPFYNTLSAGLQRTWHPIDQVDEDTPTISTELIESILAGEALL